MKLYLPTSIHQLTLIGFAIVVGPLIAALVNTMLRVDGLSERIRDTVYTAAQAVESSRILLSDVISLERGARQYLVLRDPEILAGYEEKRGGLGAAIEELLGLYQDPEIREPLALLREREQLLYGTLGEPPPEDDEGAEKLLNELPALAELVRPLPFAIGKRINEETDAVNREANELNRLLFLQALALIPLALVTAAVFSWLIAHPLRQVVEAVRHLGSGDLKRPVAVSGPQDIRTLGERLEWMRHRLNELEQQKVLFLRHVSHELKTPLTAIREGVELLGDEVVGPLEPDQAEIASILRTNSIQLQKQIENLLAFNMALAEDTITAPQEVAFDELVREVVASQALALRARGIRLDQRLAPATVRGDREKLRTIVDNLLSNAVKHSPQGGRIRLLVHGSRRRVVFEVIDEGPGIDESDRDRIFDAFYQGKRAAGGHVKGTGLGLAISERFVNLHHGEIELVDSARGAHFRLTLPKDREA